MNRIYPKELLVKQLNEYKGILQESIINYLNSLIELEFSVVRDYISDSDRKALAEFELYKNIAIYNIYNRAKTFFAKQNDDFIIAEDTGGLERLGVSIKLGNRYIELFDFNYSEILPNRWGGNYNIPYGFMTLKIGDVSLFQTLESKEMKEAEMERIMKKLESLYDSKNPYCSYKIGPGASWEFDHAKEIREYEELFKQLDNKKELNDEDKREIEITRKIYALLLEDLGLTNESFTESLPGFGLEQTVLNKTLVKKMPNLTVKNNIKYI